MGAMAVLALGIWLILFAIITAIPGAAPIQSVGALVLSVVALVAGILTLTGR